MLLMDSAMLALPLPEGPCYDDIVSATETLKAVITDCTDRIGQLHRADLDPKFGFKAMTQLDLEEELSAVGSEKITKYEKLLKQLKADDVKEAKEKSKSRFIPMPFRGRSDVKQGFRQSTYRHSSPGTELRGEKVFSFCLGFFAVFKIPYLRAVFYLQPFNFIFATLRLFNTAADVCTSFECSLMRQSRKLGFPERKCRISYGSSQR